MQKLTPVGHFVLVEVEKIQTQTESGIHIPDTVVDREQGGNNFGHIRAFGPLAYKTLKGLPFKDACPAMWGVKVGDFVEFDKYEGKLSDVQDLENFRYIPDNKILGVIEEE